MKKIEDFIQDPMAFNKYADGLGSLFLEIWKKFERDQVFLDTDATIDIFVNYCKEQGIDIEPRSASALIYYGFCHGIMAALKYIK